MRRLRRVSAVLALLALVAMGCGDDGGDEGAVGSTTTSTTVAPAPTTSLPTPLDVEVTENVRYHEDVGGYREPLLDVYAPTEGGPWPVMVMWHDGGGLFEDKDQWSLLAPLLAEQGAVVIAPTYGMNPPEDPFNLPVLDPPYFDVVGPERACVLAFVTERAEEWGGDPTDVIAFGSSGGGNVAARTVYADSELSDACVAAAEPAHPDALVLMEPDLMLSPSFDEDLASGRLDFDEVTVWDDLDRSEGTAVHLILGSEVNPNSRLSVGDPYDDEECGRVIEPGTGLDLPGDGECVWWELRDPDNALRADAERLGLFEDGWFYVGEETELLADRLVGGGQEPTVVTVDGLSHGIDRQEATLMAPTLIDIVRG